MLKKLSVSSTFFFRIKDRHRKNLRTSNYVRVSMKLGKATWSKKQHLEKARSVGTFFLTNHGNRQHKGRYCLKRYYTERGYFLLEKAFQIFSNQHWLRSWHRWKDPFNLTVKTATISWALFVDTICWNLSLKPPSHVKVGLIYEPWSVILIIIRKFEAYLNNRFRATLKWTWNECEREVNVKRIENQQWNWSEFTMCLLKRIP